MTMDQHNISCVGRGSKQWFSQLHSLDGFGGGGHVASTPHSRPGRRDACATTDVGVDGESALSGQDVHVLSDLVKQIGTSIGENIVSCLKSIPTNDANMTQSTTADLSKVNVTVTHDSYEPQPFRGDDTDRVSVSEWEDAMRLYLSRRSIELCHQVNEVLAKLRGRARDVVTIGLRSQPSLDLRSGPQPVFDILKQHFGDCVTSFMPLADFYDTKPRPTETAVDYWIRLNKAMDTAVDGLKRQGKTLDNPSREVTVMFITHCPDTELSLVFACKPLEEWTATDVQVRLDEHHRKRRLQQHRSSHPAGNLQSNQAANVLQCHTQSAGGAPAPDRAPQPATTSRISQSEGQSLEHIISLLERLLQREASRPSRSPRSGAGGRGRSRGPCAICGGDDHDTMSHCRRERLCFRCYATGHQAVTCNSAPPSDLPAVQPGGSTQQGN